jgi:2-polyprenyl-3-methyl-5-hydroxy-6-metoxy-1,4-benzoquinol methylase
MGAIAGPEWETHGIDASISGIEQARLAHPAFRFWVGDVTGPVEDLGCPIGYFDLVISTEVIEHVYAPRNLVVNAFESSVPGVSSFCQRLIMDMSRI